ncbi:hypothetical protein O1611_g306 [Lasiodiplodia mahajangana]|uniref:Uncharacterized protein n=1 Tax=Lasiodiplodia mahajangana TaxID=1108764 RepID=A0ACC2K0Q1_9PEZI|nr:hypothetical protein O1611_g306 [Lasiodiplodia mahajangana]
MAIIQGLPGVEVTVFTNGCTAREYDDPSGLGEVYHCQRVVTKYIECKDDEPFRIHLKVTDEYPWGFKNHFLNVAAVIDGIWAKGELCWQKDTEKEDWEQDISYRIVRDPEDHARYVYQEFAFSKIIKVDDATDEKHASDVDRMERLGTIEVSVYRATPQEPGPVFVPAGEHPKDFIVSQEAVRWKAPSHGTKFTRTQPAVKPKYVKCSQLSEDHGPIAVFRFKYRSRQALRQEGVMLDPQDTSDWLVEVSDKEGDDEKHNSKRNQRSLPSECRGIGRNIKRENTYSSKDIALPPGLNSDQSRNAKIRRFPQLNHSVFPDSGDLEREALANRPDLPTSALQHANTKQEPSSFAYATPPAVKRALGHPNSQNRSQNDTFTIGDSGEKDKHRNSSIIPVKNNESMLKLGEDIPYGLVSYNNNLLSIEYDTDNARIDANIITQGLGERSISNNRKNGLTLMNDNKSLPHQPNSNDSASQSARASSNHKGETQAIIKPNTAPLIDIQYHHRVLQQFQELRREFFRISDEVFKGIESSSCQSNLDTPALTSTSTPTPTRALTLPPPNDFNVLTNAFHLPPHSPSSPQPTRGHTSTPNNTVPTVSPLTQTGSGAARGSEARLGIIAADSASTAAVPKQTLGTKEKPNTARRERVPFANSRVFPLKVRKRRNRNAPSASAPRRSISGSNTLIP